MPERDIRIRIFIDDKNVKALEKINAGLQKAATAEKTLQKAMTGKNKAGRKQKKVLTEDEKALKKIRDELDKTGKNTRTWTQQIARNIGKVLEWAIATGVIYGSIRMLRTAIDDIVDVEFAMSGLTKVMREGETRAKGLRRELLALGHRYGELGDEVVDASTEWARLQISTYEIAENARVSLLAQAVAEMEVVDATKFLIANMQQFEETALSNLRTLDQWNELSNRMAVRALDLAQSAGRAGSVIHNAGDDMQFLNAMTAALVEATGRSGQAIGTAIRTMGTYTYRLRTIGALQEKAGVIIENTAGQHRRFSSVLGDLFIKWETYTDAQQRAIAQSVAGTRRQNEFLTLMRTFPEVLESVVIAWQSMNSAEKEAEIRLDTAQKKADQLRAGLQSLASEFGGALLPALKGVLDALNALIRLLIEAREIIILGSAALGIWAAKALLASTIGLKLVNAVYALMQGLVALNPQMLALVAAVVAAGVIWRAFREEIDSTTEATIDNVQRLAAQTGAIQAQVTQIDILIRKYRELRDAHERALRRGEKSDLENVLEALGEDIETAARAFQKDFTFATRDWAGSLAKVNSLLDQLNSKLETQRRISQQGISAEIRLLQEQVNFGERYIAHLDLGYSKERAWLIASMMARKSVVETMKELNGTGLVAHNLFKQFPVDMDKAREAVETLKTALAEAKNNLDKIRLSDEFVAGMSAAVLSAEELRDLLYEISQRMTVADRARRHEAALREIEGKGAISTASGLVSYLVREKFLIEETIHDIEREISLVGDDEKAQRALNKVLDTRKGILADLNNQLEIQEKIMPREGMLAALKSQRQAIQSEYQIQVQVAKARGDNIHAGELYTKQLREEIYAVQDIKRAFEEYGFSTEKLHEELGKLYDALYDHGIILNNVIRPAEMLKSVMADLKDREEAYTRVLDARRAVWDRQIASMKEAGSTDEAIAKVRIKGAQVALGLARAYRVSLETLVGATNNLRDAEASLDIARMVRERTDALAILERTNQASERSIGIAKAWGATETELSRMRIDSLKAQGRAIGQARLTDKQRFAQLLNLNKEMVQAVHDLEMREIEAALSSADAWIKAYEKRRDAWARLIGRGIGRKGVMETIERIQQEMVDRWVRTAFAPIIDKLTQWEFQMLGISPEQMRLQEQNKNKMRMALVSGGQAVQQSIMSGANYHAAVVRSAMSGQSFSMPAGMGGKAAIPGTTIDASVIRDLQNPAGTGGPGGWATAGQYGINLAPFIMANAEDWMTGRGGGVRFAGATIGGTAAGIATGGNPQAIAIGAQLGNSIVAGLQDLKHALFDNTDEMRRPQSETLREQVGSAISRGTFGQATQIAYHQEFNITMGFLIPEREGLRKAVSIIKDELGNINANVSVGA